LDGVGPQRALDAEGVARHETFEALDRPRAANSGHGSLRRVELPDSAGGTECALASLERRVRQSRWNRLGALARLAIYVRLIADS
jgi:hypothetical protein